MSQLDLLFETPLTCWGHFDPFCLGKKSECFFQTLSKDKDSESSWRESSDVWTPAAGGGIIVPAHDKSSFVK